MHCALWMNTSLSGWNKDSQCQTKVVRWKTAGCFVVHSVKHSCERGHSRDRRLSDAVFGVVAQLGCPWPQPSFACAVSTRTPCCVPTTLDHIKSTPAHPPRPPGPNQPGTSGLWVHGMGKPPQYRVQRTSTDFCVPPREPFRPISTTGGLWGDGRASEAIATPTGGPPSRIRRSKASGGGAGCRAVATRGCGAGGAVWGQRGLRGCLRPATPRCQCPTTHPACLARSPSRPFLPKRGLLLCTDNARKRQA